MYYVILAELRFKFSLKNDEAAELIEQSIGEVLDEGYRTSDIYSDGDKKVGTNEISDLIAKKILSK